MLHYQNRNRGCSIIIKGTEDSIIHLILMRNGSAALSQFATPFSTGNTTGFNISFQEEKKNRILLIPIVIGGFWRKHCLKPNFFLQKPCIRKSFAAENQT
jgi:hypothetical protein